MRSVIYSEVSRVPTWVEKSLKEEEYIISTGSESITLTFGNMSCGLIKLKLKYLILMTMITFEGEKMESLQTCEVQRWQGGVSVLLQQKLYTEQVR